MTTHTTRSSPPAQPGASAQLASAQLASLNASALHHEPTPPPPTTATGGIPAERYVGFVAGLASGATKLLVGHPFDTVKVRLQTEGSFGRFSGPLDCMRATIRKEGFRALYKGATPPLLGWAMMDSVQMGSLNNLRLLIAGGDPETMLSIPEHAAAGLGAGIVVSFVATPVELLKGKLQVQYDAATRVYKGPVDCARKLVQAHGIPGLYQGLSACLLFRSFFWVLWGSYEVYRRKFTEWGMSKGMIPFFAGGCAANTFWTISFPADVLKQRMMTQPSAHPRRYPTVRSCAQHIWRTEGLRGFYRGFVPCFLRSFPTNGAAIFVYDAGMRFGKRVVEGG
ncbi:mitochondrial carrier domain-containing protein [Fimicolochytrium jonesii]|uniref:mitochondrial carrier domain-containing protein n=1 Tax=Fimicolochytrium jonesii TaxID=1396493 RepID=UPI0022FF1214|nr:mitochondrial carrier domain-containing protein [Fimicolochytrium jonesii]KAI8821041.1 mitochondrial carrier domain-containing protein [Fimicolochytrium jonesii]